MSRLNFTEGPWHIRTFDGSQWTIDDQNDNSIAQAQQVKPLPDDRLQVERTANARLISAAPELLEACMRADQQMELAGDCIEAGRYDEALLHIRSLSRARRQAIAKALGE